MMFVLNYGTPTSVTILKLNNEKREYLLLTSGILCLYRTFGTYSIGQLLLRFLRVHS
jgi:hypothetical protein